MKCSFGKITVAVALCLCMLWLAVACEEKPSTEDAKPLSYDAIEIEEYLRLGDYTELTVSCLEGESRGEAVWRTVRRNCELICYPEAAVDYYVSQSDERCRYYAEEKSVSIEDAMAALGMSEESIRAEAEALVFADLVYHAVREDAEITLTEEDKNALFDRYVDKYVSDWGYERDYVVENLSELVYDSMRYDKTTEYLIVNNEFAE